MNTDDIVTLAQVQEFLDGTRTISFELGTTEQCYAFVQRTLVRFGYLSLSRTDKGRMLRYLCRVSGYSRQQMTRLVEQFRRSGRVQSRRRGPTSGFPRRYTAEDVRLLAKTDELHGTLSGPATKRLLERAYEVFGQGEYQRLAGLSVSHLYNLRQSIGYQRRRHTVDKTRPVVLPIGERRKPNPQGQPGYIRIDTVHQGDLDRIKGLYHLNGVDEITQFEVVCTVERISEAYLLPVLTGLLEAFPFTVQGFHSDNGSEFINRQVATLLNKLLIEFTKSRARRSNDNALVESKNGTVVRKHLGYAHIPQRYAAHVNAFTLGHLTPYLNFHRPCFFARTIVDTKGKQRKTYPYEQIMTPYEKLKSLPEAAAYLKPGITFQNLDALAYAMSDNEAAKRLNEARQQLFKSIAEQENTCVA